MEPETKKSCELCGNPAEMDFNAMFPVLGGGTIVIKGDICLGCYATFPDDGAVAIALLKKRHDDKLKEPTMIPEQAINKMPIEEVLKEISLIIIDKVSSVTTKIFNDIQNFKPTPEQEQHIREYWLNLTDNDEDTPDWKNAAEAIQELVKVTSSQNISEHD